MLAITYLGLIIFIVFFEITRSKETKIDFLTLFHLNFCLFYALPGAILEASLGTSSSATRFNNEFQVSDLQIALAIFGGYFFILLGFHSKTAENLGKKIIIKSSSPTKVFLYAVCLLLFACFSIYIYSLQYGGFMVAISKANLIRAGAEERGIFSFFKRFILCSFVSAYLLGSYIFCQKIKKGKWAYIIFGISVIASIIAFLMSSSRAPLVNFILVFYLGYVLKTGKFSWLFTISFTWIAALFIFYGKAFFFSLTALPEGFTAFINRFVEANNSPDSLGFNVYELLKQNFAYPVDSLYVAFHKVYNPRLFVDWYYSFISLVPEKLSNIEKPETISEINTRYLTQGNEYVIQPGLLAYGIYVMSWPGMMINCIVYGWFGRYVQSILSNYLQKIFWMPFIYILIIQIWIDILLVGDPVLLIQINFWSLTSIGLLLLLTTKLSIINQIITLPKRLK
ncbi:hypothetical protein [Iningainema tapete]|uniref:Oligosaccharide repeat unit polymerase n=1 Tax=Iningainema tapete BLCC-T55 TaxID=2748662 RepID=A0A8J7CE41_9CYAN|nr:hypothetical protein [Iningainema tapete]MBD2773235.1 hypothetical protein [Iningainema tapete BLCC-T55]